MRYKSQKKKKHEKKMKRKEGGGNERRDGEKERNRRLAEKVLPKCLRLLVLEEIEFASVHSLFFSFFLKRTKKKMGERDIKYIQSGRKSPSKMSSSPRA
jgi:hypothetical protein